MSINKSSGIIAYTVSIGQNVSQLQTKKSQPEGKWIMLERRFTKVPALYIDPRVGISWSASGTNVYFASL